MKKIKKRIVKTGLLLLIITTITACSVKKHYFYPHLIGKKNHQLRVVTYNVNWGNGIWKKNNYPKTIAAIKRANADIVLLQETTPKWQRWIKTALSSQYQYQQFRDYENAGGLAILSKYPFHTIKYIPKHPTGWHPALLILATTPLGKIQILNLHLSPSITHQYTVGFLGSTLIKGANQRAREMPYLYSFLNHHQAAIIAGDFNENHHGYALKFLQTKGYANALNIVDLSHHTWQWQIGIFHFANRMDHVFYTPEYLILKRTQVLHEGSSDHFPVIVDFARNNNLKR